MTNNAVDVNASIAKAPEGELAANTTAKTISRMHSFTYEQGIPSVGELYADLTIPVVVGITIGLIFWLVIFVIFCRQVRYILKNTPKRLVARTIMMNAAYPIVATAAVVSILIPKAIVLCDSVCHLTFVVLAYQYFCLTLDYAKGETNLIKMLNNSHTFTIRTPPCCCCWPCLKPSELTKRKLTNVRVMILQMPIVQTIILITLNVINIEDHDLFNAYMPYFAPFLIVSILTGVWGLNIITRLTMPHLMEVRIMGKFLAIQLVLVLCKLQPAIVNAVVGAISFEEPGYPVTPKVLANIGIQVVILFEMLLLALWASVLYKVPSKVPITIVE